MAEKKTAARKTAAKKETAKKTPKKTVQKKEMKEELLAPEFLSTMDRYLFNKGVNYQAYKKMGAHATQVGDRKGMHFAVWAPNAKAVSVVCDRNGWNPDVNPMVLLEKSGIWEAFIDDIGYGEIYKYAIKTQSGETIFKADPYAFSAELRPGTASKTAKIDDYKWHDAKWMTARAEKNTFEEPMAIYECHLGSWLKPKNDKSQDSFMNYRELAHELADYCKYMGYTHVELMGIAEHPFDGSWGYQVTGYYAPTSRYGEPKDFMYFVDHLHKNGIGVILDWVPAHFPKDAFGLADFDGTPTYEHPDPRMGEHPDWGTKIFNYSKSEVRIFLIGNALYWYNEYHIDGLRVDAVASMLYLDYGRKDGEWIPNKYGGNGNLDAMEFFKHLNTVIRGRNDGTIIIAEESTAWPKLTESPKNEGLGFTYKWNMGWMHDFLEYMKLDPYFRKDNHNKMTFAMSYAYSEKYVLVLSHDEVVHLKCSMINKMPGYEVDKFANLKCGYAFMFGHAGKKLLFMGQDFGQEHEWDEKVELSWDESGRPLNKSLQDFVRDLLHIYQKYPALYRKDDDPEGFKWVNADDNSRSIFSFIRRDGTKKKSILFVINMTPMARDDYMVGAPVKGKYTLLLDQEGSVKDKDKQTVFTAEEGECDGQPFRVRYPLPPYGIAVFSFNESDTAKKPAAKKTAKK